MPQLAIGREDAVSEEVLPFIVEWFAFAIVIKLRGKDGLGVLRIRREDEPLRGEREFDGLRVLVWGPRKEPFPEYKISVHAGVEC